MNTPIYTGTSGLTLPVPNKTAYPPEFREQPRLVYYAALFNSIEINSSFYKIPQANTLRKWAALVPDDFRFTFKLWKELTHQKELNYAPEQMKNFLNTINAVGEKKGALLVQFPPSVRIGQLAQLSRLLQDVQRSAQGWDVAVEFRHPSLYTDRTDRLLNELGMTLVIHDLPAAASPAEPLDAPFIYLRFHGPQGGYRGSYADETLTDYAGLISEWKAEGKSVYVYFNNTMGPAAADLQRLQVYLGQS